MIDLLVSLHDEVRLEHIDDTPMTGARSTPGWVFKIEELVARNGPCCCFVRRRSCAFCLADGPPASSAGALVICWFTRSMPAALSYTALQNFSDLPETHQ